MEKTNYPIKTIRKYFDASDIFNNENKNYKIDVFYDFDFLHIYINDVNDEKYEHLKILNNHIQDYSAEFIVEQYYKLVDYLFEKWK